MMKILVLNCGGSSMKYQLIDMKSETVLVKGLVDRLGTEQSTLKCEIAGKGVIESPVRIKDFANGIRSTIRLLIENNVIEDVQDISAFAHKIAHGGPEFREAVFVTDEVIAAISEYSALAQVHNPPSLKGIILCQEAYPTIPQVVYFETGFHTTLPEYVYTYGVPSEWASKYHVRKFGFHGASHSYVTQRASELMGVAKEDIKLVSCHLGSGTSVAAIEYGRSVDISSGLTPQSGTIMSTRPGDLDPWVFPYVMKQEGISADDLALRLIKEGGLLGISGVSGDMRDILNAARDGNQKADLAVQVFCYQVKKYIGAFVAAMNGIDCLVFTGGIGEHNPEIRERIGEHLDYLGIMIDPQKNRQVDGEGCISPDSSRVRALVIHTNEEHVVAKHAAEVLRNIS